MKVKFLLLAVITSLSLASHAQKNTWYLGGSLGVNSVKSKTDINGTSNTTGKGSSWNVGPEIGTFLTDHVQLGLGLNISGSKNTSYFNPTPVVNTSTAFGADIYSRYFFGKEAFKPFAGILVGVSSGKTKSVNGQVSAESKVMDMNANLNAGFSYALSKRVSTIGSFGFLGYTVSTNKFADNSKSTSSSFGFEASSLGNRFTIGFYYSL